jgi:hypothetical protein
MVAPFVCSRSLSQARLQQELTLRKGSDANYSKTVSFVIGASAAL